MERQTAIGVASGVTLAVVGGVSALMLTAGPSIAGALDEPAPAVSVSETVVEPAVYVVDEQGNLVQPDAQGVAPADSGDDAEGTYEAAGDYEEYEDDYEDGDEHEEGHEEGDYEDDHDEEHEDD